MLCVGDSIARGIGIGLVSVAYPSMMADAADEHEHLFGRRREGLYFAGLGFASKAATGVGVLLAGMALAAASCAMAQAYPNKPIRLIVPYPPGGGTDTGARIIAEQLSKRWGQTVAIDNKGGAGGNLGAVEVKRAPADGVVAQVAQPISKAAKFAGVLKEQAATWPTVVREIYKSIKARSSDADYVSVFQAPRTILNQPISASRRFAAQSWHLPRIKAAAKRHNATLNDIVLAMCAAAVRKYLIELNALPDKPLVAMVPMSLRKDDSEGGNQVGVVLANLATHLADPLERLDAIARSVQNSKDRFATMNQLEIMNYVATAMAVSGINMATGIAPTWQAFNIVVSNVPGPRETLYWNGAKLEGIYPVSIAMDGQATNITVVSYAEKFEIGIIACRRTLPHMQKLLQYLEDGLAELEA